MNWPRPSYSLCYSASGRCEPAAPGSDAMGKAIRQAVANLREGIRLNPDNAEVHLSWV